MYFGKFKKKNFICLLAMFVPSYTLFMSLQQKQRTEILLTCFFYFIPQYLPIFFFSFCFGCFMFAHTVCVLRHSKASAQNLSCDNSSPHFSLSLGPTTENSTNGHYVHSLFSIFFSYMYTY